MSLNCTPTATTGFGTRAAVGLLSLPFDAVRLHYAACVQAGLIRPSILESRDLERALASMERLTLGPWARRN